MSCLPCLLTLSTGLRVVNSLSSLLILFAYLALCVVRRFSIPNVVKCLSGWFCPAPPPLAEGKGIVLNDSSNTRIICLLVVAAAAAAAAALLRLLPSLVLSQTSVQTVAGAAAAPDLHNLRPQRPQSARTRDTRNTTPKLQRGPHKPPPRHARQPDPPKKEPRPFIGRPGSGRWRYKLSTPPRRAGGTWKGVGRLPKGQSFLSNVSPLPLTARVVDTTTLTTTWHKTNKWLSGTSKDTRQHGTNPSPNKLGL